MTHSVQNKTDKITKLNQMLSLVRLVQAKGFELKEVDHTFQLTCPWCNNHQSLITIEPVPNQWSCNGHCGLSGNLIDFVMKVEGVSFKHACELLQSDSELLFQPANKQLAKNSSTRKIDSEFNTETNDQTLLNQVIDYYHRTLKQSPEALAYLSKRGINNAKVIEHFKLGYSARKLGYLLPDKNRKQGKFIRTQLETIGVYRKSGHEHLAGSLVIPVLSKQGDVLQAYGRKTVSRLRKGTPKHLFLSKPFTGVFNESSFNQSKEIILCSSFIDAMTFWSYGYHHVTSVFEKYAMSEALLSSLTQYDIRRVLMAFYRDEQGNQAARTISKQLMEKGIEVFSIHLPQRLSVNAYALKMNSPSEALGSIIRQAEWLGNGALIDQESNSSEPNITSLNNDELITPNQTVEDDVIEHKNQGEINLPATPLPEMNHGLPEAEVSENEVIIKLGNRRYRIRGLQRNHSYAHLKINLLVGHGEFFHVDNLDLYSHKHRISFINNACQEIALAPEVLKKDLGKVLLKLESLQEAQINDVLNNHNEEQELTPQERQDALAFLQNPNLIDCIKEDFESCGVVGESINTLIGYLASLSRHLPKPLAVIIQSSSAAGKSSVMDAILAMVPEEQKIQFAAMTGQSLFYMGETNLKHKILAISEEEGAEQAAYALKLLQSQGELTIASTGKDAQTGRLLTHEYRVEGPIMLMLTTTAIDIDEELLNRCLVLTVNETREQTKRIHDLQRQQRTLHGLLTKVERESIIQTHQHAQRLLKKLHIVNPFAEELAFSDFQTRMRRDHEKYLTLIESITLLFQYQREVKQINHQGEVIEYIEVTKADIEIANELAKHVLNHSMDELPPQTRKLFELIQCEVKSLCENQSIIVDDFRFTQKQMRDWTGWGNTQLKVHLKRLVDMEYMQKRQVSRHRAYQYSLLYTDNETLELPFLKSVS